MNEQIIFLLLLIPSAGITIFLPFWKSKKEIVYKKDERWQLIQNKANNVVNYLSYTLLVLFLVIGQIITINFDIEITFTLNRLCTYAVCFIGLRNGVELFALRYYDNRI